MKKVLFTVVALLIGVASFAQESNRDANGNRQYGPYETNRFWDNWFLEIGGGADATLSTEADGTFGLHDGVGYTGSIHVGKWITPSFGLRAGWRIGKSPLDLNDSAYPNANIIGLNLVKADLLFNICNLFWGYKSDRVYELVPYLGFGGVFAFNATQTMSDLGNPNEEFMAEIGFMNLINVSKHFSLNIDLSAACSREEGFHKESKFILFPAVTLGGVFRFNRNDWTRKATTVASYAAAVAAAEAAAGQAKSDADAAKKAAADQADADAKQIQQLKDELAAAQAQAGDYSDLFDEPIVAYFEIGQSKLSNKEKEHVKYVAKNLLSRGENIKFTLSGNADTKTGSAKRNQQLSQERADYVYKMMTEELGIDGSRFTVQANGGNDVFDSPELNRAVIIEKQ